MNPITIITAIPNIHTDSYKKRWSLGVGVMPIAKWGLSSTKSYTDRHYRVYN